MPYKDKENQKESARRHYEKNKQKMKDRAKVNNRLHRQKLRDIVFQAKSKPCMDCKLSFIPFAMDFDHRENEIKLGDVSSMVGRGVTIEVLKTEIAKCDIVCAICHRLRTYTRVGGEVPRKAHNL